MASYLNCDFWESKTAYEENFPHIWFLGGVFAAKTCVLWKKILGGILYHLTRHWANLPKSQFEQCRRVRWPWSRYLSPKQAIKHVPLLRRKWPQLLSVDKFRVPGCRSRHDCWLVGWQGDRLRHTSNSWVSKECGWHRVNTQPSYPMQLYLGFLLLVRKNTCRHSLLSAS